MIILLCLMCLPMYLCFNVFMLSYRFYRIHNKDYMRTLLLHVWIQHTWQCICYSPLILFYPCFYCCIVINVFTYDTRAHVLCVCSDFFLYFYFFDMCVVVIVVGVLGILIHIYNIEIDRYTIHYICNVCCLMILRILS